MDLGERSAWRDISQSRQRLRTRSEKGALVEMSGVESGYLPRRNTLELALVPKGAAISSDVRALGEALHMFVTEAKERALFTLDELPADVVAVFRAYEFANALDSRTIASWFVSVDPDQKLVDETATGLGLIGCDAMAALLREAG